MERVRILREQLKWSHDMIEQAVADLTPDQLHHRAEGSTIASIAAVYTHTVMAEDALLNVYVRKEPLLIQQDGWVEKIGLPASLLNDPNEIWTIPYENCDFAELREYAQQVYAATDDYLRSLAPADLEKVITFGSMGELPLDLFLTKVVAWHTAHHGGEICALKGTLGLKGLPF